MKREIKFRGQRADNREWVTGNLLKTSVDKKPDPEFTDGIQVYENGIFKAVHAVLPETVGQYTGLKDKNGVEIFESDVVRFNVESRPEVEGEERVTGLIGKVEIGKYCTTFGGWQTVYCSSIIVVGNIHSNPELLK